MNYVNIQVNSAILMGKNFTVDGFAERPVRIITHAHADHLLELDKSIVYSKYIIASPITLDLIKTLGYVRGELLALLRTKSIALNYNDAFTINNEECTLLESDHIPGSTQVVVRVRDKGLTIGYTGDFKLTSKTKIIEEPNILVIESTYGNPLYSRSHKDTIPQILVDLVLDGLSRYGRIHIYAYHGKIQEVMGILREKGINAPFILPDKIYDSTKMLEDKYGFNYGEYYRSSTPISSKKKAIMFKHFNTASRRKLDGSSLHIILTGRFSNNPYVKVDDYTYVVSLSDHADFNDLVEYVNRSNPELVVIDGSRSSETEPLWITLLEKGFCSITLPWSGVL